MNQKNFQWTHLEPDGNTFILRSSRPFWRWLSYWFNLVSEAFWICILTWCAGLFISLLFIRIVGDLASIAAVTGAGFLALCISFALNVKSDPFVPLELRFFLNQHNVELRGRSGFGFLVVRRFRLDDSVRINQFLYEYEVDGNLGVRRGIDVVLDQKTNFVADFWNLKELEDHMTFFLNVLPLQTSKEILITSTLT